VQQGPAEISFRRLYAAWAIWRAIAGTLNIRTISLFTELKKEGDRNAGKQAYKQP